MSDVMMDVISHPSHYAAGRKFEPKDVIRDWGLNFSLGNAVKYISRAGRKDASKTTEDLRKAIFYIEDEIAALENSPVIEETLEDLQRSVQQYLNLVQSEERQATSGGGSLSMTQERQCDPVST